MVEKHSWKWRRTKDREEQVIRRARRHGRCYLCLLNDGVKVKATHGDLCAAHFAATDIPTPIIPM